MYRFHTCRLNRTHGGFSKVPHFLNTGTNEDSFFGHISTSFLLHHLSLALPFAKNRPTARVSRKWAGWDSDWEQRKLEARKKLKKRAESHLSAARCVSPLQIYGRIAEICICWPDSRCARKRISSPDL